MKKILSSLGMIVFVGAVVVGGTGAFFSDTETSTANVFTAGAIDLLIDNSSYGFDWNDPENTDPVGYWGRNINNSWELRDLTNELFFNFHDLKPGDYGEDTISIHVNNNDAYACMALNLTGTPENGQNEPESKVDLTAGENEGELQNYLSFLFWHDDGDNVLEDGEEVIPSLSGLSDTIFTGKWLAIAESGDTPLTGGKTSYLGKGWCFGDIASAPVVPGDYGSPTADNTGFTCTGVAGDHNDAQTDGITVDVAFHAVQARHNENFMCSQLPPLDGNGEGRAVGAALAHYKAPGTCDINVPTDYDTIQAAVDAAAPNQTVCVADDTYSETVSIVTEGLTLASVNGPTNTATIDGGVIIGADNVVLTGFVINPGSFLGTNAAVYLNGNLEGVRVTYNDIDGLDAAASRGVETTTGSTYANVFIENNFIHDLTTGIYTNPMVGGPFYIRFNDIDDNVAGIGGLNGALVVANEFDSTGGILEAIGVDSTNDANPASVSNNNFLNDTRVNTYGGLAIDLAAKNNFWGPNGGAAQTGGTDQVDFTPEAGGVFPHN